MAKQGSCHRARTPVPRAATAPPPGVPTDPYAPGHVARHHPRLLAVRISVRPMARAVSGVRGVEYPARGAHAARSRGGSCPRDARRGGRWDARRRRWPGRREAAAAPAQRGWRDRDQAPVDGGRRARPRARGRLGAGLARAAGRVAGDRQVDAHEHGARAPGAERSSHAVRERGGVGRAGPVAR